MTGWELSRLGAQVTLFEAHAVMSQTSQASTKMLHGGLRYLAQGRLGLVRESLMERRWWLDQKTPFTRPIPLILPVARRDFFERLWLGTGVKLYDLLATGSGFPKSAWIPRPRIMEMFSGLRADKLSGGWQYWDAAMDDYRLGQWAADQAKHTGVSFKEQTTIEHLSPNGTVRTARGEESFDLIVNACGPWAEDLLDQSGINHRHCLDLVRGSHLVIDRQIEYGLALPHCQGRLIFLLPYQGRTLLGTTEVLHKLGTPIAPTTQEIEELLSVYNLWFDRPITAANVIAQFSGLRPIVRTKAGSQSSKASREAAMEWNGRILTLWGGKWTTSRQLGIRAAASCVAQARKIEAGL